MQQIVMNGTPSTVDVFKQHMSQTSGKNTTISGLPLNHKYGCYGWYFQLTDDIGVKVLKGSDRSGPSETKAEFQTLMECWQKKPAWFPKPYGVIEVEWNGVKYYGIVMQHINGKTVYEYCNEDWSKSSALVERMRERLRKLGINHTDLHARNMMVEKRGIINRYRVIDCDPRFIWFSEAEKDASAMG